MKSTGILDASGIVVNAAAPTLLGVRLIVDNDDNYLEIYDNKIGPETGRVIAYLDKDVPFILFDKLDPFNCDDGMYAFLPEGGRYIVYYN